LQAGRENSLGFVQTEIEKVNKANIGSVECYFLLLNGLYLFKKLNWVEN